MKTTLLIMAAGIGSRFGTGIKQLEPVDDAGLIIMDIPSMMRLRLASTMWYLSSVRISSRSSKRLSVSVSKLSALPMM